MKIEVITLNVEDTLQAQKLGADRVELVSAMTEGGLTPSFGTIKQVLEKATIPVQIMIRPHNFGFVYNEADWLTMKEDIAIIRELGGNRIVIGAVTQDGEIDEEFLEKVIEHAPEFDITFHRAFDTVRSPLTAYRTLTKYKSHIKRVLTSGGAPTAKDGIHTLKKLVKLSRELDGPEILVGSGVSPKNLANLHQQIGANEYHIGSGIRIDKDFSKPLNEKEMTKIVAFKKQCVIVKRK